jgi:drug/metabolite transporter (DMT)-like permease
MRWSELGLVLAIIATATSAPLVKAAAPAPALTVGAGRIVLAALLLAIASGPQLAIWAGLSRAHRLTVVASGGLLAIHFGTWITSLYLTSTAASVALVATQPVFAGLLGWLVIGDRMDRREVLGIAIAAGGCIVIGAGDFGAGGDALLGDLLALAGAVTAAGYLVLGRKLRQALPLTPYLAMVNGVAAVLLAAAVLIAGAPVFGFSAGDYAAIAGCAVVPSIVGHTLLNWSVRRIPVHLVSLAILGEPIGASLITWALFAETPPIHAVIGGATILGGIAVGFSLRRVGA